MATAKSSKRNKAMPEIEIELDKKRKLVFDFNAMCRLEEITGKNSLQGDTWENLSALDVRALLWGALLRDDKDITLEDVGGLINFSNLSVVTEAIQKAFEAAAPDAADLATEGNE